MSPRRMRQMHGSRPERSAAQVVSFSVTGRVVCGVGRRPGACDLAASVPVRRLPYPGKEYEGRHDPGWETQIASAAPLAHAVFREGMAGASVGIDCTG
jgi:hypothetical protein